MSYLENHSSVNSLIENGLELIYSNGIVLAALEFRSLQCNLIRSLKRTVFALKRILNLSPKSFHSSVTSLH